MTPNRKQTSIGKLIYITFFAATIIATLQSPVPYAFIYPAIFVVIMATYVIWSITRPDSEPRETIIDEWEQEESDKLD